MNSRLMVRSATSFTIHGQYSRGVAPTLVAHNLLYKVAHLSFLEVMLTVHKGV